MEHRVFHRQHNPVAGLDGLSGVALDVGRQDPGIDAQVDHRTAQGLGHGLGVHAEHRRGACDHQHLGLLDRVRLGQFVLVGLFDPMRAGHRAPELSGQHQQPQPAHQRQAQQGAP